MIFFNSQVWVWELDHKEGWALKNWCFWIVVLEKTKSALDCKEIKLIHPKQNQSWIFIGRIVDDAEAPILWLCYVKNWLIGKDPDAGKDWRHKKGTTEEEIVTKHNWLNEHKFEQTPGCRGGQQSLTLLQSIGLQRVRQELSTKNSNRVILCIATGNNRELWVQSSGYLYIQL